MPDFPEKKPTIVNHDTRLLTPYAQTGGVVVTNKPKKVAKPYASYPLFGHQSGRWVKKTKGRFRYFGSDPQDWQAYCRKCARLIEHFGADRTSSEGWTL